MELAKRETIEEGGVRSDKWVELESLSYLPVTIVSDKHRQYWSKNTYVISEYTFALRTGKIIPKTDAGQWALGNNLCPVSDVLKTALKVRKSPLEFKKDEFILKYAQTLGEPIQKFADVLEKELQKKGCIKMLFEMRQ